MKTLTFLIPLCLFSSLFAEEELISMSGQAHSFGKEFANMLLTLGVVLAFILLTVWFLKKIMRSRLQTLNRNNGIKILERRPLNPKASLYLVDILGKGVVVAESSSGIQLITELPEGLNIESLLEQKKSEEAPSFTESFSLRLKKALTKKTTS